MLKQRIITASLLLPAVLAAIFFLPIHLFALAWIAALNVAAYELARMARVDSLAARLACLGLFNALVYLLWEGRLVDGVTETVLILAVIYWCYVIIALRNDPVARLQQQPVFRYRLATLLSALLIIIPTWLALVILHEQSPWLVLHVFCLVWIADVGAYFSGKRFGRHKLAPMISPGKTWEGVWGAITALVIYALTVSFWVIEENDSRVLFIVASIIAGSLSVYGDLLESVFKRVTGMKDSGTVLPGHGGAMDRLDSITAAAPIFAVGYVLVEWL